MPDDRIPKDELGTEPGLAGGPGPNPPGFDDGTPRVLIDGSPGRLPREAVRPSGAEAEIEDREGGPAERRSRGNPESD